VESLRKSFAALLGDCSILDYQTGENNDSIWTTFNVNAPQGARMNNSMMLVRPNIFQKEDFPSFAKSIRRYPIWFGGPHRIETKINVRIPGGWRLQDEALPSAKSACKNVARLEYEISAKAHAVHFRSLYEKSGELLEPSDYETVRMFGREMRAYNKLTFILNSK
jgi:hypothetical protein